ncbi:MAG: hypothetical protein DI551_11555 [Micavibrio aeruginosavorus]|uniref:N-acetyltransferase domain-containing protein n=1 Tax=Micavibrio aeruginosavorus TaxID=349221 RepID=A0A2W5MQX3_9BACT|nr:MAG: hypothetical protein DI551_11555 [Micavibrio aeruginosavorus]
MISIRPYNPQDYEQVAALYKQGDLYGGQFDPDRDSPQRLKAVTEKFPEAILVAERTGKICGTVSLIEDPRTAWLFRFAAPDDETTSQLFEAASLILKSCGHKQVLVHGAAGSAALDDRYASLGFTKGGDFTCFWIDDL